MQSTARLLPVSLGAALALTPFVHAQTPSLASTRIGTVGDISLAASPPGQPGRLIVLSRSGRIYTTNPRAASPSLTQIGDLPGINVVGGGNGHIALAFHPQFLSNGFIYFTRDGWPNTGVRGMALLRVRVVGDPATFTQFDSASLTSIINVRTSSGQHTGGWCGFGPDGRLYLTSGDGHNDQVAQNTQSLSGKLLRLDVDGPDLTPGTADDDAYPADPDRHFVVPGDNPFAEGRPGGLPEIWAVGLRNPYRASFDRSTGRLLIGDVGAVAREEITMISPTVSGSRPGELGYTGGLNLGWPCYEGTLRISSAGSVCSALLRPAVTFPILEYRCGGSSPNPESVCVPAGGNSVVGSILYRGCAMPAFAGRLLFVDYSTGLFSVNPATTPTSDFRTHAGVTVGQSFGMAQDGDGELYICGQQGIYRLRQASPTPADCNQNGQGDACEIASNAGLDRNRTGVLDSCECPADFDGNGIATPDDLDDFITAFFNDPADTRADFDGDGVIGPDDLADFVSIFFDGCP